MDTLITLIGVVFFIIGVILIYTVRRRRFYRRGPGGLQHFRTYRGAIFNRLWEGLAMIIGTILFVISLAIFIVSIDHAMKRKNDAKQLQKTSRQAQHHNK